ncbi:hypothetical protein EMIT0P12_30161 [Pseudomonas sp. IT-P12]
MICVCYVQALKLTMNARFRCAAALAPHTCFLGGPMAKMSLFLGGFLVLTLLIGALATISPV